jgi:hypothetical protein
MQKKRLDQSKIELEKALARKMPLVEALKNAESALALGRKKLSESEGQYQSATQALATTEKEWKLAISDLQNKIEDLFHKSLIVNKFGFVGLNHYLCICI